MFSFISVWAITLLRFTFVTYIVLIPSQNTPEHNLLRCNKTQDPILDIFVSFNWEH